MTGRPPSCFRTRTPATSSASSSSPTSSTSSTVRSSRSCCSRSRRSSARPTPRWDCCTGFAFALFYTFAPASRSPASPIGASGARSSRAGLAVWSPVHRRLRRGALLRSARASRARRRRASARRRSCRRRTRSSPTTSRPRAARPRWRSSRWACTSVLAFGFLLGGWIAQYFGWRRVLRGRQPRPRAGGARALDHSRAAARPHDAQPSSASESGSSASESGSSTDESARTVLHLPSGSAARFRHLGARGRAPFVRRLRVRGVGSALLRARPRNADARELGAWLGIILGLRRRRRARSAAAC